MWLTTSLSWTYPYEARTALFALCQVLKMSVKHLKLLSHTCSAQLLSLKLHLRSGSWIEKSRFEVSSAPSLLAAYCVSFLKATMRLVSSECSKEFWQGIMYQILTLLLLGKILVSYHKLNLAGNHKVACLMSVHAWLHSLDFLIVKMQWFNLPQVS